MKIYNIIIFALLAYWLITSVRSQTKVSVTTTPTPTTSVFKPPTNLAEIRDYLAKVQGNAQNFYNFSYHETQSSLDIEIFKGYERTRRPVKDESSTITVGMHFQVTHLSINEDEQTMSLNGHLYMTWKDEYLGWNIRKYNGVRSARAKKWEIWNPKFRIANSINGVSSVYDIAGFAHVTLYTHGEEYTMVEMYPTFSLRVGCNFDFTDFPNDEHTCSAFILPRDRMNKIIFEPYNELPASLSLAWGTSVEKSHISEFQITNISTIMAYDRGSRLDSNEPEPSDYYKTRSVMRLEVSFRRVSPLFTYLFQFPCMASAMLVCASWLLSLKRIRLILPINLANLVLQVILWGTAVQKIPLAVGAWPPGVCFYMWVVCTNFISAFCHMALFCLCCSEYCPPKYVFLILHARKLLPKNCQIPITVSDYNWPTVVFIFRFIMTNLLVLFYFYLHSLYF